MATKGCGDANAVGGMALELFQLASLLAGDEGEALGLIENALAVLEIDPCLDPEQAKQQARRAVVRLALTQMGHAEPAAFAAPASSADAHDPCIQDDDLRAAGVTQDEVRGWLEHSGKSELRQGLRSWIEKLPLAQRVVFVQRAVLGQDNDSAAELLRDAVGEPARGWTRQEISQTFRQALCSLANALAHAPDAASSQPA